MVELMEKFGRTVRAEEGGEPLFAPGEDLSWLDRAAAEDGADSAGAPRPLRLARVRAVTAAAAAVVLVAALGWWALAGRGAPPGLTGVRLSTTQGVLRGGEAPPVFRSGDRVWLHANAGAAGFAFVALLDERDQLAAVTGEPVPLHDGHNAIGPFVLDDRTGTATLILLATRGTRSGSWFPGVLGRARRAAQGAGDRAGRLAAIVKALRAEQGAAVSTVTYEHVR